jgi:hypothetical protein
MSASKNQFLEPVCYDHVIGKAEGGSKVGEIRVKPSSILWKPRGQQKYFSATLDDFSKWIAEKGKLVDK